MREPAWTGHEIGASKPDIPIITPHGPARLRGIILSERQLGVWVHWNGECNVPCMGEAHGCKLCQQGVQRRWRGFLMVAPQLRRGFGILEYTDRAADRLGRRLTGQGKAIKNCAYLIFRKEGAKRGEVVLEVAEEPVRNFYIGPVPDLRRALVAAWYHHLASHPNIQVVAEEDGYGVIPLPGRPRTG